MILWWKVVRSIIRWWSRRKVRAILGFDCGEEEGLCWGGLR